VAATKIKITFQQQSGTHGNKHQLKSTDNDKKAIGDSRLRPWRHLSTHGE